MQSKLQTYGQWTFAAACMGALAWILTGGHSTPTAPSAPDPAEPSVVAADAQLAPQLDTYASHPTAEARDAVIRSLRKADVEEALEALEAAYLRAGPRRSRSALLALAVPAFGRNALGFLSSAALAADLDRGLARDLVTQVSKLREATTIKLLLDWHERPAFAECKPLLTQSAVALGTAADAERLGAMASKEPAERQRLLLKVKLAIESKLRAQEKTIAIRDASQDELIAIVAGSGPEWERLAALRRLEVTATPAGLEALAKLAPATEGMPSQFELNVLASLSRSSSTPDGQRALLSYLRRVAPTGNKTTAMVVAKFAPRPLASVLSTEQHPWIKAIGTAIAKQPESNTPRTSR